jgi:YD repeat-containing protein
MASVASVLALTAGTLAAVTVAAGPASAAANPAPAAGERRNATRLDFTVSGTAKLSVDVGSGNALFTDRLITLPGVTGDVPISLYYNSSVEDSTIPSAVTAHAGSGWSITGFDQRLIANADGTVTYLGPGGLTGVFTPNGTGTFAPPVQFRADLKTAAAGGWTLTEHTTSHVLTFTAGGRLGSDKDRNGNTTTYSYDSSGTPSGVTSSRGVVAMRTLTIANSGGRLTTFTQTDGSQSRAVTLGTTAVVSWCR